MLLRRHMTQLVLAFLILWGSWQLAEVIASDTPEASTGDTQELKPLSVEVFDVNAGAYTVQLETFGTLSAATRSDVYPLVSGQIMALSERFKSGLSFRKGDVLLELDATEYRLAVQQQRSELAQAEVALDEERALSAQAQRDWKMQKRIEPISDYALRKPQLALAQTNLDTARAKLAMAELNLERTRVRAPYDGVVISTQVDVGEVVSSNLRVSEIYADQSLEVRLPIASRDVPFIELPATDSSGSGAVVEFSTTLEGQTDRWTGALVRSDAEIDAASQQVFVVARVDASQQGAAPLKLGQYLHARIQGRTLTDALAIPNSAIYQGAYVYVVRDGRLYRQDIRVRWRDRQFSVIEQGLTSGDQVILTLLGQVTSGTAVSIEAGDRP